MSRIMEEIWKRGYEEGIILGKIDSIKALLTNEFTLEEAFDALGIPFDEREMYIKKLAM